MEAARKRAAREQQERLKQALQELQQIRESKPAAEREQARVSLSEPEARVMKNGQGGFAPSYNVQSVVDGAHKIVLDVEVTQAAGDQQQLKPALERMQAQRAAAAAESPTVIVDGGYVTEHSIVAADQGGVEFIGPALEREQARQRGRQQSLQQAASRPRMACWRSYFRRGRGAGMSGGPMPGADFPGAQRSPVSCRGQRLRGVLAPDQVLSAQRPAEREIQRAHPAVEAFHERMRQPACCAIYKRREEIVYFPHAGWK